MVTVLKMSFFVIICCVIIYYFCTSQEERRERARAQKMVTWRGHIRRGYTSEDCANNRYVKFDNLSVSRDGKIHPRYTILELDSDCSPEKRNQIITRLIVVVVIAIFFLAK